mmetsp:Transcript_21464/g.48611  ORF Transcript_21464/g.48611 Transcript_21464/m.48611 type:complete len:354 (+) Transcript_21464:465-1526(+)
MPSRSAIRSSALSSRAAILPSRFLMWSCTAANSCSRWWSRVCSCSRALLTSVASFPILSSAGRSRGRRNISLVSAASAASITALSLNDFRDIISWLSAKAPVVAERPRYALSVQSTGSPKSGTSTQGVQVPELSASISTCRLFPFTTTLALLLCVTEKSALSAWYRTLALQPSTSSVISSYVFVPSLISTVTSRCDCSLSVFLKVSNTTPRPTKCSVDPCTIPSTWYPCCVIHRATPSPKKVLPCPDMRNCRMAEKSGTRSACRDQMAPFLDCRSGVNRMKFLLTTVAPETFQMLASPTRRVPSRSVSSKGGWKVNLSSFSAFVFNVRHASSSRAIRGACILLYASVYAPWLG